MLGVDGYFDRFKTLTLALADGSEADRGKCDQLAREAVTALGDEVHVLANHVARSSGTAYFSLAIAMDNARAFSAIGPDGAPAPTSGLLKFCAVAVEVPQGGSVPRRLGLGAWMPPLPDGRPVPAAADFLLTFEEAYSTLSGVRRLHDVFGGHTAHAPGSVEDVLAGVFGGEPKRSAFDRFARSGEREASLRFLPAYAKSASEAWFQEDEQMREWQRAARKNLADVVGTGPWPYPMAPASYLPALEAGFDMWLRSRLKEWLDSAPQLDGPDGGEQGSRRVQLEVFGSKTGTANSVRLTLLDADLVPSSHTFVWFVPFDNQKAEWQKTAKRVADLLKSAFDAEVLYLPPVVQDQEFLFSEEGSRRLHVILGRPMAFSGAPDGLPWDFPSDPAMKPWVEHERRHANLDGEGIKHLLEAVLELNPGCLKVFSSLTLFRGAWHPGHVVYFREAQRADGAPVPWPLPQNATEMVMHMFGLMGARDGVGIWHAGEGSQASPVNG
jgi:hypothetical protein